MKLSWKVLLLLKDVQGVTVWLYDQNLLRASRSLLINKCMNKAELLGGRPAAALGLR